MSENKKNIIAVAAHLFTQSVLCGDIQLCICRMSITGKYQKIQWNKECSEILAFQPKTYFTELTRRRWRRKCESMIMFVSCSSSATASETQIIDCLLAILCWVAGSTPTLYQKAPHLLAKALCMLAYQFCDVCVVFQQKFHIYAKKRLILT